MRLTQRQINLGIFGILLSCVSVLIILEIPRISMRIVLTDTFTWMLILALFLTYLRGWAQAPYGLLVLITFAAGLEVPPNPTDSIETVLFIYALLFPPVFAQIIAGPRWIWGCAITTLGLMMFRANGVGLVVEITFLILYGMIVSGISLSRLAIDNVQRIEEAKREAETERTRAEAALALAQEQATTLTRQNTEQRQLLDLIATLETPTITIADGVLLAPIVGTLDSRRTEALTSRLLAHVAEQSVSHVILDIAGVQIVDATVAQALARMAQALRLLGCNVALTGISPDVATILIDLDIVLDSVTPAHSPQDVLDQLGFTRSVRAHGKRERASQRSLRPLGE